MIMKKKLFIILPLLYPLASFISAYSIDTLKIYSEILKETRKIIIYKPDSIQLQDSVSIIYLLDGESSDYLYKKISEDEQGKALYGIGIINNDRRRDLLPINGADKFLEFISSELIPALEDTLSIKERILFGHSFGGAFTVFSLIAKPGLFDKYIASSPTPIMNMVDPSLYQKAGTSIDKPILFYFSYGSEDLKQVIKWTEKLKEGLLTLNCNYIIWQREIHGGENHSTNDIISLIRGIGFHK
jgi:hypothetical protein